MNFDPPNLLLRSKINTFAAKLHRPHQSGQKRYMTILLNNEELIYPAEESVSERWPQEADIC